jgi:hypothetical protein
MNFEVSVGNEARLIGDRAAVTGGNMNLLLLSYHWTVYTTHLAICPVGRLMNVPYIVELRSYTRRQ